MQQWWRRWRWWWRWWRWWWCFSHGTAIRLFLWSPTGINLTLSTPYTSPHPTPMHTQTHTHTLCEMLLQWWNHSRLYLSFANHKCYSYYYYSSYSRRVKILEDLSARSFICLLCMNFWSLFQVLLSKKNWSWPAVFDNRLIVSSEMVVVFAELKACCSVPIGEAASQLLFHLSHQDAKHGLIWFIQQSNPVIATSCQGSIQIQCSRWCFTCKANLVSRKCERKWITCPSVILNWLLDWTGHNGRVTVPVGRKPSQVVGWL